MLLDSPLLPTDHRDSPRTVSTDVKTVNTLTTTCRELEMRPGWPEPRMLWCPRCRTLNAGWKGDSAEHYCGSPPGGANCLVSACSPASLQQAQPFGPVFRPRED